MCKLSPFVGLVLFFGLLNFGMISDSAHAEPEPEIVATAVGLTSEAAASLKLPKARNETIRETLSRGEPGIDWQITSHIVVHEPNEPVNEELPVRFSTPAPTARKIAILSTPLAQGEGRPTNPKAQQTLEEVARGETGRRLLSTSGLVSSRDFEWQHGPTLIGERNVDVLGGTLVKSYFGITAEPEGRSMAVLMHLARGKKANNMVFLGYYQGRRPTSDSLGTGEECATVHCEVTRNDLRRFTEELNRRVEVELCTLRERDALPSGACPKGRPKNPPPSNPPPFVDYVEVNQAVQNELIDRSGGLPTTVSPIVPMLPGKTTVVRYYFIEKIGQSSSKLNVGQFRLKMEVIRGGSVIKNVTLNPNNSNSSISVPEAKLTGKEDQIRKMRADLKRTLNFVIPGSKVPDNADRIRLKLNPRFKSGIIKLKLDDSRTLGVNIVPVDPPRGGNNEPSQNQIRNNLLDYVRNTYPISELAVDWKPTLNWDGNALKGDLSNAYSGRKIRNIAGADNTVLQGVRPRPYNVGNAWCGGRISQSGLDGNVAAQEIGHSLDLEHISSTHNTGGMGNEPTPYSHGVIGEFDLSGSSHETAPSKWGNVGVAIQKQGGSWDAKLIPAGDPDSNSARDHVHEFMSYGSSPGGSIFGIRNFYNIQGGNGAWISDTIYERLYDHILNEPSKCNGNDKKITRAASAPGTSASAVKTGQAGNDKKVDALLFTTTFLEGQFQNLQLIRKPIPRSQLQRAEEQQGRFTVELQDKNGNELLSRAFDLLEGTNSGEGTTSDRKLGQVAMPFEDGIKRIVVRQDGEVVAERQASPNPPEINVINPNGGEVWQDGIHTIRWEVSDPDGEQPGVLIEYSPDGGNSWHPLGIFDHGHLPEGNTIEVNVNELDASTKALIRVAATDGVNTTQDRSDGFFSAGTDESPQQGGPGKGNGEEKKEPPQESRLVQYDANDNCRLDNPELTTLIDDWSKGNVKNSTFLDGVEAWANETDICPRTSSVQGLTLATVMTQSLATEDSLTFRAIGQGIEAIQVDIYALSGQRVFSRETNDATLQWSLTTNQGAPVANGVYLYRVTVEGTNGEVQRSQIKKLLVLR